MNKKHLLWLPLAQLATAFVIGLLIWKLATPELAKIVWALGLMLTIDRYTNDRALDIRLSPVERMAGLVDLNRTLRPEMFSSMLRRYSAITEPEFAEVKDSIIDNANEQLRLLAREKVSGLLSATDYYNWIFVTLKTCGKGNTIHAISRMESTEWDETPAESEFLREQLAAAKRGATIKRLFVCTLEVMKEKMKIPAISLHAHDDDSPFAGYFVDESDLAKKDPELLKLLGDGFLAFGSRVTLIDKFEIDGTARGQVTMAPAQINQLLSAFEKLLKIYARPIDSALFAPAPAPGKTAPPGKT